MEKVAQLVDIKAPCEDVFNTIMDVEKRMQLSPLWGISRLIKVSADYPQPGSSYQVRVLPGAPYGVSHGTLNASQSALAGLAQVVFLKLTLSGDQSMLNEVEETAEITRAPQQPTPAPKQTYFIDTYQPPNQLGYHLDQDCKTVVTWQCQAIPSGTRVNYEEIFCDEQVRDENFIPTVQTAVREWLANIKRYSELRTHRWQRVVRWFLDRVYLKLRPDQRRAVSLLLIIQAIGLGTFIIAALGWLIARALF